MRKARRAAARRGRRLRIMFADEARFGRINRAPAVLGADRNAARGRSPAHSRIHLFVRRGLAQGRLLRLSNHADVEHRVLPGLPSSAGTKVRPAGHPAGSRRRSQPSLRRSGGSRNITLLYLPPYSPELNPKENLWDEIREKIFKNYALKSIGAVRTKLKQAILYIEHNPKLVQSITSFPYIVNSL